MAYQFVHLETYSRKGRDGRDVGFILNEAARVPEASLHVSRPVPPDVVFGVDVDGLRRLHDERAAAAVTTLANGKARAVRRDQNTLVTVVASHPATMDSLRSSAAVASAVKEWEDLTVAWLRKQYGDQLVSVVRHVDEAHPHVHAYVLPDGPEMRAGRLHPGQEAKRQIIATGLAEGDDGKSLNRRADVAYRTAMRGWQDSYWNAVGLPSGLTRLGPARRRLTREEWHAERTQAQAVQQARERVVALHSAGDSFVTRTRSVADATIRAAEADAAEIHAAAIKQQDAARRAHDAAEERLRKAESIRSRARREGSRIVRAARCEADRLRTFGVRIRSLWDGLRHSVIESRVRQSVAAELARESQRASEAGRQVADEARKRRDAEQARECAIAAAHALGRERDSARRQLAALMPDADLQEFMQPRTGGPS